MVDSRLSRSCCATCSRARPTGVSGSSARGIPRSQCRASSGSNGTVPRQGISRPEGCLRSRDKERLDGVAVAAVVAAHVLDVTEEAIGSLRQRGHRARDHAPRHLGRDRHEQERGPRPEKIGVLDGPLGSRRQIEHQQIERSPLEGPEDLAEESELPRGAPRVGLSVRRALELERLRLRDQRAHREDRRSRSWSAGARPCGCRERTAPPGHLPCAPARGR